MLGIWDAPADALEMRLQIDTPQANLFQSRFAISPDGRAVVFRSAPAGATPQLWIRSLASEAAEPLAGTDNASGPFWSPDGRAIGFFANAELKRLEVADGRIRTVATPAGVIGGAWNTGGTILFTTSAAGPLYRVAAEGGEVTQVTRIDPPRTAGHVSPQFLPDGRHFLFFGFGWPEGEGSTSVPWIRWRQRVSYGLRLRPCSRRRIPCSSSKRARSSRGG